jgi:hypothetical protein
MKILHKFSVTTCRNCRSQWTRMNCLRSLERGSWVRIPLEAWMYVCVYSVFVLGSGPVLQVGATGINQPHAEISTVYKSQIGIR